MNRLKVIWVPSGSGRGETCARSMADSKKRGGGPKTPHGKVTSSQNSTKHGCTSKVLILENEDPADLEAIRAGWFQEFEPEGYQEERLVENLVLNDWWLKRAQRNLDEAEAAVFGGGGDFHRVELMQRYKTTHERAFYRALSALQGLRKDIIRERMENVRLQGKLERSELELARLRAQQTTEGKDPQADCAGPTSPRTFARNFPAPHLVPFSDGAKLDFNSRTKYSL